MEQAEKVEPSKPAPVTAVKEIKKTKKKKEHKEGKTTKAFAKTDSEESEKTQEEPTKNVAQGVKEVTTTPSKAGKKQKKEKGKGKEKTGKKKTKKGAVAPTTKKTEEVLEPVKTQTVTEGSESAVTESAPEVSTTTEEEPPEVPEGKEHKQTKTEEETEMEKPKEGEKPKKKKKKKHHPEVVVQPWADLEEQEEQRVAEEAQQRQGEAQASPVKRMEEVFSDWSDDDSPGGDAWFDDNDVGFADDEPALPVESGAKSVQSGTFDDVYDPISDEELDVLLGEDEEQEEGGQGAESSGTAPMAVEDVDWSALVTAQASSEKKGNRE